MNHELALSLEMLEQAAWGFRFRLVFRNQSAVRLLLPYPEIHGLRFVNKTTLRESEWYTRLLVSAAWHGFTIHPGADKPIDYRVRPCNIENREDDGTDYYRWCVELPPGEYLVWFKFEVGEDYFCCDSHYEYTDLLDEGSKREAIAWTGIARSNRLHVVHAPQ